MLALAGCEEIALMDHDKVEATNLNRLPLPLTAIGQLKVEAIAAEIVRLRPETVVLPVPIAFSLETDSFVQGRIVYDCTDRVAVQRMIYDACQKHASSYFRSGCDAQNMTSGKTLPWIRDENAGGYAAAIPMWVGPAVIAAAYSLGVELQRWAPYTGALTRKQ